MNTLLVFSSKHGGTEKCANKLLSRLKGKTEVINLKGKTKIDLTKYDTVIIGGSVYVGQIRKDVKMFCADNLEALKGKRLGLFICCYSPEEVAKKQLETAYPAELSSIAIAKESFGGEFIFENMNFLERVAIKKIAKVDKSTSNIPEETIVKFADAINNI
jgi:menaquinone-dependent protoporphyrinogen oxidase